MPRPRSEPNPSLHPSVSSNSYVSCFLCVSLGCFASNCFHAAARPFHGESWIVRVDGFQILCRIRDVRREKVSVKRKIVLLSVTGLLAVFFSARDLRAQGSPENSSRELQIWTGGGHGINGS